MIADYDLSNSDILDHSMRMKPNATLSQWSKVIAIHRSNISHISHRSLFYNIILLSNIRQGAVALQPCAQSVVLNVK